MCETTGPRNARIFETRNHAVLTGKGVRLTLIRLAIWHQSCSIVSVALLFNAKCPIISVTDIKLVIDENLMVDTGVLPNTDAQSR